MVEDDGRGHPLRLRRHGEAGQPWLDLELWLFGVGPVEDDRVSDQSAERGLRAISQGGCEPAFVLRLVKAHFNQLVVEQGAIDRLEHAGGDAVMPDLHHRT